MRPCAWSSRHSVVLSLCERDKVSIFGKRTIRLLHVESAIPIRFSKVLIVFIVAVTFQWLDSCTC